MNRTTVYAADGGYTTRIKTMVGPIVGASMWNTITNVLRQMKYTWLCLGTSEEEYYITADDCLYIVKK